MKLYLLLHYCRFHLYFIYKIKLTEGLFEDLLYLLLKNLFLLIFHKMKVVFEFFLFDFLLLVKIYLFLKMNQLYITLLFFFPN